MNAKPLKDQLHDAEVALRQARSAFDDGERITRCKRRVMRLRREVRRANGELAPTQAQRTRHWNDIWKSTCS